MHAKDYYKKTSVQLTLKNSIVNKLEIYLSFYVNVFFGFRWKSWPSTTAFPQKRRQLPSRLLSRTSMTTLRSFSVITDRCCQNTYQPEKLLKSWLPTTTTVRKATDPHLRSEWIQMQTMWSELRSKLNTIKVPITSAVCLPSATGP